MTARSNEVRTQPIGYWTGEAYRHIARAIRESLAAEDLTQPQWWMLNHLAHGQWTRGTLLEQLAPFNANEEGLDLEAQLDGLLERDWLVHDPMTQHLALTATGEERRLRAWARNGATHHGMIAGVSEREYDDCIDVLQRIVGNLGGDPSPH